MNAADKNKKMKEITKYLDERGYFHRLAPGDGSQTLNPNKVVILLESSMRFDIEYQKLCELNLTWECSLTYACTMGGNYIGIEVL
jgi:hypothetical protein